MKNIRNKFETSFSNLGHWICRNRFITLFLVLAFTGGMLSQINQLTVDTSNDVFYHPDDPAMIAYNQFRDRFGKDDHIIIGIKSNDIFSLEFLQTLRELHQEIEDNVPHLKKVTSLINVRNTYGAEDELIVEDLVAEEIPNTPEALDALKQKVFSNPFYMNYLVSKDGQLTILDLEPNAVVTDGDDYHYLSTKEYGKMMAVIDPILAKFNQLEIHVSGIPVVSDRLAVAIEKVMAELAPLAFLLNIIFLTLLFRRISGVIYPILIVFLAMMGTIGAQAWLGYPITLVTSVLPTLLIVVGVADSVHLLSGFYREYHANGGNKEDAIAVALGNNGLAILMTTATTSVGLMSFAMADIGAVAQLGVIAPVGIILAFIYTVLLLPALIAIFPMRQSRESKINGLADRLLIWVAEVSCRRYKEILVISAGLFFVAITGAMQLVISHNALSWFPETSDLRKDVLAIDEALNGSATMEVVIDTGKTNGLYDPELMNRLDQSMQIAMNLGTESIQIGNTNTISVILKEVNRALHANQDKFYVVPNSRELTAQELLLFEMSEADDLHKLVAEDYSMVRFTIMVPFVDAIEMKPVLDKVIKHFQTFYPDANIVVTGVGPMLVDTMYNVLNSMVTSYSFALIVITILMILLIGQIKIGTISMIPNLLPIALVMGIMGWMALPFDFSNMLAGSITIGLVVDDTIHFLHNFRRHFEISGKVQEAVRETLLSAGRAIFITSTVLAAGLALNLTADLGSTVNFGIITCSAVVLALLADFFLAPALMVAIHDK
jgi:predicted RND superfamily exporter protein